MKKHITYLAIALVFGLSSCNDYLSVVPKGKKIPTSMQDFSSLMQDEYGVHRTSATQALNLLNDNYVTLSNLSYYPLYKANYFWDENADRIALNNSDETTYYAAYGAINVSNLVMQNILTTPDGTDAEKKRYYAQAQIIRAMNYFLLINFYSDTYDAATAGSKPGVPLITSADVNAPYTQVSVQAIYDFIIKDVQEAIPNLAIKPGTIIEPSVAAAYAFLARVYLQMDRYTDASAAADQALAQNNQLYDWNTFYEANKAKIDLPTNYERPASPMGYNYVENFYFTHGGTSSSTSEALIRLDRAARFETNDIAFKSRWKIRTVGADTYYYSITNGFYNYGGLTTTEVYLIKAECLARTNDVNGAMNLLNQVRAKRILTAAYQPLSAASSVEAIKLIQKTKMNALILTYIPFADARRWNKDTNYAITLTKTEEGVNYTLLPTSHMWTMPFPMGAVKNAGNGTITQNVSK